MKEYKSKLPELSLKYKTGEINRIKVTSSRDIEKFIRKLFDADTIEYSEEFLIVLLNRANNTIGYAKISSGGIAGTVVDIKMILTYFIKSGASSMIMAHNHPSGNLQPSKADKTITNKVQNALSYMDGILLDHIIVTNESYFSFTDEGLTC